MIHIGAPEVLGRGVDDEYHFGRDGICALAGLSGRLFDRQWEIVSYILEPWKVISWTSSSGTSPG